MSEELDELNDEMGNNTSEDIALLLESQVEESEQKKAEEIKNEQSAESNKKVNEAMGIAVTGIQIVSKAVEKKWDCINFDDKTKVEISEKTAAVLAKYDCKLPPWLEAYKEEIELGLCLGGVIAGCYMTVQKHKKELAANDEGDQDGAKSEQ